MKERKEGKEGGKELAEWEQNLGPLLFPCISTHSLVSISIYIYIEREREKYTYQFSSVQFISVAQSCPTLYDPMDCSTSGFPVHHQLPELVQTHVHRVSDAIQPFHPLSSPSPPAFNLSQHQVLFQWVSSSHQVTKVLVLQLQHQSFQWIFRTDFLQGGRVGFPCTPRDSQESSPTPQFKSIN